MTELAILDPGHVYMAADRFGELLYVGSTNDFVRRRTEHRRLAPWWPDAAWFGSVQVGSIRLAREFERTLIAEYQPRHNVQLLEAEIAGGVLFRGLPFEATAADLAAILHLQESYLRRAAAGLDAYRDSMAAYETLRASEDETVGQCKDRLRKQGPITDEAVS